MIRPPFRPGATPAIMRAEADPMATMLTLEQETNPWQAAEIRFDEAASRLGLNDGVCKILRSRLLQLLKE